MGGMETYALRLSQALGAHGEVEVIALPGRTDGGAPRIGAVLWFGLRTFARLLATGPADVTHVADMASWPLALAGRLRASGRPVVLSAHGTDVAFARKTGLASGLYRLYMNFGALFVGRMTVIANSRATADIARWLGFSRITVVPLATDFQAPEQITPGSHLLFSGRLIPRKGLLWFTENVLPQLPAGTKLHVAGKVWDQGEARALDDPRVKPLGILSAKDLARAYAEAGAVIVPNIDTGDGEMEGFGLVAAEAAASGGVVLAANIDGLTEAVRDGETGMLLPPGDAEAWTTACREVLEWSDDTRRAFVDRAMTSAARHYSWPRVAQDTFALYDLDP
jgi:glycosyltransferase involved in cell wall biosynthesis